MTHKNIKGRTFFRPHASQGPTKTGYYPDIFASVLENPHVLHRFAILFTRSCLHRKRYLTFSTMKPSQTSSTEQKRKSDKDPQEISGPKKRAFSSNWLEEFAWLMYVSTEKHMKCKTCLNAYGRSAKPSQAYVHNVTHFQRSAFRRRKCL